MDIFEVMQGVALPISVAILDDQGDPVTRYRGTEPLTATVWPGGSAAPAFHPAAAWTSARAGTASILVTSAQTAALPEGRHRGTLAVLDPVEGMLEAYCWAMDVLPAPGTATLGLPYCKYADLLRLGRTAIKKLQAGDDLTGFAAEIDDASRWLDDLILARYPTAGVALLGSPGYGATLFGGAPGAIPSLWLRGVLAGGGLVLRPKVAEAVALRALASLLEGQVGEKAEDFRLMGRRFRTEASATAATLVAEICTDGTGVPSFGIPLGYTSTRPLFF